VIDDDDTDAGGDFFVDMVKTAIGVFFILVLVVTVVAVIWGFLI
jgi:hypothetical protein